MIQKFEETGSFELNPGRERKSIASTSVVVEDVATAYTACPFLKSKGQAVMCKRALHVVLPYV